MTDETIKDTKDDNVDISSVLEAIEKKVTEKLDGFSAKIDTLKTAAAAHEEPETDPFADDDDGYISKKELPKVIESVVKTVKRETNSEYEVRSKKQRRDTQAIEDFPELKPGSSVFNKKLYDETAREIETRVKSGRNAEDVDLVYDSAASVASRGVREGWYNPRARVVESSTRRSSQDDSFDVRGNGTRPSGVTEGQVRFAQSVGLSKERLTQLIDKTK